MYELTSIRYSSTAGLDVFGVFGLILRRAAVRMIHNIIPGMMSI